MDTPSKLVDRLMSDIDAIADGSEVVMQRNPRDAETHNPKSNGSSELGYSSVYATALLDMAGGAFLDAVVQPGPQKDEPAAFRELEDRCDPSLALVGDRNFTSYNNFAHCLERGVGFVVRLTDALAGRPRRYTPAWSCTTSARRWRRSPS